MAPSFVAAIDDSVPRNDPMGVRHALAMTTSFMGIYAGVYKTIVGAPWYANMSKKATDSHKAKVPS
jgi:hypothetical protein